MHRFYYPCGVSIDFIICTYISAFNRLFFSLFHFLSLKLYANRIFLRIYIFLVTTERRKNHACAYPFISFHLHFHFFSFALLFLVICNFLNKYVLQCIMWNLRILIYTGEIVIRIPFVAHFFLFVENFGERLFFTCSYTRKTHIQYFEIVCYIQVSLFNLLSAYKN